MITRIDKFLDSLMYNLPMITSDIMYRAISINDWPIILEIQKQAYPQINLESEIVLASKVDISPDTCWVIEYRGTIVGYLLAHPWVYGDFPELNYKMTTIPQNANIFYIHDFALRPDLHGIGAFVVTMALQVARQKGYKKSALIAVQGSSMFWEKMGYHNASFQSSKLLSKNFAAYGKDAQYMERNL